MVSIEDDMLRTAVSAMYFGGLADVHDAYNAAGRTDLALQAHAQHGSWLQVNSPRRDILLLSQQIDCIHFAACVRQEVGAVRCHF